MVRESNKPVDSDAKQAGEQMAAAAPQGDGTSAIEGQEREPIVLQVESLKQELDSMKDKYLRALADWQNSQKRASVERAEAVQRGQADLAKALLPVLDNLERTLDAARTAADATSLAKGVRIIHEQMLKVLGEFGLRRIDLQKGDPFDPVCQQAVAQQPSDEVEPEHILHVAQAGYTVHDRMLRPAAVVVARQPRESQDTQVDVNADI
jgi:molecular chaperone GrpE